METKPLIRQPAKTNVSAGKIINIQTNVAQVVMGALNYELMVAWHGLASTSAKQRFYDKAFPVLKQGFGEYVDARALTNPASLHHVYEWNRVGDKSARLWTIKKVNSGESFKIVYSFLNSKIVVPIDPILKTRGASGRSVTKSYIFKNKAIIMESGTPVVIKRKQAKFLTIPSTNFNGNINKNITFTKGPITVRSPGGKQTKLGFSKAFEIWFGSGLATKYLKSSNVFSILEEHVSRSGKNIPSKIKKLSIKGSLTASEIERLAIMEVGL